MADVSTVFRKTRRISTANSNPQFLKKFALNPAATAIARPSRKLHHCSKSGDCKFCRSARYSSGLGFPKFQTQPLFHDRGHQIGQGSAKLRDFTDQFGAQITVTFSRQHVDGLQPRLQLAIHKRHLQLILVIGDSANAAQYEGMYYQNSNLSLGQITGADGTSNTFAFGETIGGSANGTQWSYAWMGAGSMPTAFGLQRPTSAAFWNFRVLAGEQAVQ